MSDREEFEKWYTHNFGRRATEFGYETDICWQAWQAARAQGGEAEGRVAIPRDVAEAKGMYLVGYSWLKHNAPDELTDAANGEPKQ